MNIVKNKKFWIGFVVGAFAGPMIVGKVAPGLRAKIPG